MCNKKNEVIDLNSSALYLKQLTLDLFLLNCRKNRCPGIRFWQWCLTPPHLVVFISSRPAVFPGTMSACADLHLCHPHCVHLLGSALQGEEQQESWRWCCRKRACGVWRWLRHGADTAACWWTLNIGHCRWLQTHLSQPTPSTHFKQTDSLPEEPGVFSGFAGDAVCFLFWLCFLILKAAFDISAALNVHLSFLQAHPSLDPSLSISASSRYVCAFSYPTTVSLFCKSLSAPCRHCFSVGSPKVQLSATYSFPSFILYTF